MRSSRSDEPAPIVDKTRGARASRFAGAGYVRHYRTQAVDNLCDALARVSHETNGCATATHRVVNPLSRVPRAASATRRAVPRLSTTRPTRLLRYDSASGVARLMRRLLVYLWAAPTTCLGLLFLTPTLLGRVHGRVVN